jgi:hypothetical protein
MDEGDDRLKDFLYRSDRCALLLATSGCLSLESLPGLEDFSEAIPRLLSWIDAHCAGFLKVCRVTQSSDAAWPLRQLVQISHTGSLIAAIEPTSSHEIGFKVFLNQDPSESGCIANFRLHS